MVWMKWDIVMENCEFVSVKKQNIKMRKKMKYTFNEKDLFDLFISPLNPDFQTPSLMDGYVYATDGLRLIKIKADTLNGDYEPNGRLNEMMSKYRWPDNNCNCHITKEHIRQALASAPQKEELINVDKIIRPAYKSIMVPKVYESFKERSTPKIDTKAMKELQLTMKDESC